MLQPEEESQEPRRLVLGGQGGVGKTQLTIAYINRHRNHYPSVFWLNATSETTIEASYRSAAAQLFDLQHLAVQTGIETIQRVHRWLSDPANTQWLLVFDNYDDPDQYDIQNYYPSAFHGTIVVTTRRPDLVSGDVIHVKPIRNTGDSLEILATRSQRADARTDVYAERLVNRLDGLPLALATVGSYLRTSNSTFEHCLQEYEKRWNLDPYRPLRLPEYPGRTLYTTWDLSYGRLQIEDPAAAELLKVFAYFDNQRIWYELLRAGASDHPSETVNELVNSEGRFNSAMRTLTDYCFVEAQSSMTAWSVHSCVQDWISAILNSSLDVREYRYAFSCVARSITPGRSLSYSLLSYAPVTTHALWLVRDQFWDSNCVNEVVSNQLENARLVAQLFSSQLHLPAAERLYSQILVECEDQLAPGHKFTISILYELGYIKKELSKSAEAESLLERALADAEKMCGQDHVDTLNTVNRLGLLRMSQGRVTEAEQLFQRALAGYEKALGPEGESTLFPANNLGDLYRSLGRLVEAEQMFQRVLTAREKLYGPEHEYTLTVALNLGLVYQSQNRLAEAELIEQRALAGLEKTLGPEHRSTLSTVNALGIVYDLQAKDVEAEQMHQRALAGRERTLGPGHEETLATLTNLGLLYYRQGKLVESEQMYRRALAGHEAANRSHTLPACTTMANLGLLYRTQGQLDQANVLFRRALAGRTQILGPNHPVTLKVAGILAEE